MNFLKKNHDFKQKTKTMKNTLKTITILFLLTFVLQSCNKDDDGNSQPQEESYFLTAKIDGVDYSRDLVTVSTLADETGFYTISGIGESSSIGLTLESPTSTGTFTPTIGGSTSLFYQEVNPFIVWGASEGVGSGTITITVNNATFMEGTFSFTGVNPADNTTRVITEGRFKAQKL